MVLTQDRALVAAPVLPPENIVHHGDAGDRCVAGLQSRLCRLGVKGGKVQTEQMLSGLHLNSGHSAARPAGNGNIRARLSSPVAPLLSKPGRGALSSGRWTRRGYRSAPYIHNIVNAELWVRVMAAPPVRKEYNERRSLRFDRNQVQARKGSAPDGNIFQHR